jgi:hypothetical protein
MGQGGRGSHLLTTNMCSVFLFPKTTIGPESTSVPRLLRVSLDDRIVK